MLTINITNVAYLVLIVYIIAVNCSEEIKQLPHCRDNDEGNVAVVVGTLDGKLSALNSKGSMLWNVDTGPGPLLISNIHKLELTNNGQLIRIIPSLTGNLYKFDGKNIDSIPINADDLLKSSFLYSDDLVLAGGKQLRTYGVGFNTGKILYECSLYGCQNKTDDAENEDILVIERTTITVRAHEPRSGTERWNFSVGLHNIKLPQISCIDTNNFVDFDLSVIVPKGILNAILDGNNLWTYKFDSPIVTVWKWTGEQMIPIDLFTQKNSLMTTDIAALYVGMHNRQLYIQESDLLLNIIPTRTGTSVATIPWKPISATDVAVVPFDNDRTTGISVLYSSEYVNGNGFYLYINKGKGWLYNNETDNERKLDISNYTFLTVLPIILQITLLLIVTVGIWKYQFMKSLEVDSVASSQTNTEPEPTRSQKVSESSDITPFHSRFANDFETVSCLGKGGFGIVFEVRRNLDECCYAIKRITLPKDDTSKEKVMREVKTLAKLDHRNIVRYYNSWVENPPVDWSREHDQKYLNDTNEMTINSTTASRKTHKRSPSTIIDIDKESAIDDGFIGSNSDKPLITNSNNESFGIYFENSNTNLASKSSVNEKEISSIKSVSNENKDREISSPVFLYIQMQLCQKESLRDWLLQNRERNYSSVLNIFSQILDAVEYIHNNGLIHRDLKPSNIFFSMEGNIKVGDFGLVRGMEDTIDNDKQYPQSFTLQSHTRGVGTQLYMSPEQKDGKSYNYKVDIWSLGIIFFELLFPFQTEMERTKTLTNIRCNKYPETFLEQYANESDILKGMLCQEPNNRPSTSYIKSRPIFYSIYNKM